MTKGLIIGKFMPLHNGHISMIEWATNYCDELLVLVCFNDNEPINGAKRYEMVKEYFRSYSNIHIDFIYENNLPDSSESSREISLVWAKYLNDLELGTNIIFGSEEYVKYLAEYMNIDYKIYDINRIKAPISATLVRNNPYANWSYIPKVTQELYIKTVCIYGSESCGKSILTKKLADTFKTSYVPEMARYIGKFGNVDWDNTTEDQFIAFAKSHYNMIKTMKPFSNKVLFVDSDNLTTQIYAKTYIGMKSEEIEEYDRIEYDLYLLMKPDVPFIQDGTRKYEDKRLEMHELFKQKLIENNRKFIEIGGDWEERYNSAVNIINQLLNQKL